MVAHSALSLIHPPWRDCSSFAIVAIVPATFIFSLCNCLSHNSTKDMYIQPLLTRAPLHRIASPPTLVSTSRRQRQQPYSVSIMAFAATSKKQFGIAATAFEILPSTSTTSIATSNLKPIDIPTPRTPFSKKVRLSIHRQRNRAALTKGPAAVHPRLHSAASPLDLRSRSRGQAPPRRVGYRECGWAGPCWVRRGAVLGACVRACACDGIAGGWRLGRDCAGRIGVAWR